MDVYEVRRLNLLSIKERRFGSITELAAALGQSHSYTSRLLTDNPKHRKRIAESARDIEERLGLKKYSLDTPIDWSPGITAEPAAPGYVAGLSAPLQQLLAAAQQAERAGVATSTLAHVTGVLRALSAGRAGGASTN